MDAVGNITVKSQEGTSPQTMTYNAAQRLTTMQQGTTRTTYTYDNNGNTTVEQVGTTRTTSTYDRENRMTLQQAGTARTTYAYDGDGLRRRMVTSGGTTTYVWDGTDYQQVDGSFNDVYEGSQLEGRPGDQHCDKHGIECTGSHAGQFLSSVIYMECYYVKIKKGELGWH